MTGVDDYDRSTGQVKVEKPFRFIVNMFYAVRESIACKLKYQLYLFFFLVSGLPILILGAAIHQETTRILVDRATQSSTDLVMKRFTYFEDVFDEINQILYEGTTSLDTIRFLQDVNADTVGLPESATILERIAAKFEYMLTLKGDIVDSIMILPGLNGLPFFRGFRTFEYAEQYNQLEVYRKTVTSQRIVFWSFESSPGKEEHYITASASVIDGLTNRVIGVIVIYLDVDKVRMIFEHPGMTAGEILFVMDPDNTIIYHSDITMVGHVYDHPMVEELVASSVQGSERTVIDGQDVILTHYTSENSGWRIITTIPYSTVIKDVDIITVIALVISIFCLGYAFLIAFIFNRSLCRPIDTLILSMSRFGEGRLGLRIGTARSDELGRLSDGFDAMAARISDLIDGVRTEQRLKKESEIKALQSQITPHFLYNTLNGIKAMVRANRKEDAEQMTTALAGLLKLSLSHTDDCVTVFEELNYVKHYVEIMEYRFEKKVTVVYDIDNTLLCHKILKFILQPIVENCFIHAFSDSRDNMQVSICINHEEAAMLIEVTDNGIGMDLGDTTNPVLLEILANHAREKFSAVGLMNIEERIKLNYGQAFGLGMQSQPGEGMTIYLRLPLIT